jgi:hypothetical protein
MLTAAGGFVSVCVPMEVKRAADVAWCVGRACNFPPKNNDSTELIDDV